MSLPPPPCTSRPPTGERAGCRTGPGREVQGAGSRKGFSAGQSSSLKVLVWEVPSPPREGGILFAAAAAHVATVGECAGCRRGSDPNGTKEL